MVGSIFEDVTLEWAGKSYKIPARAMMGAIKLVERHITLKELLEYEQRNTVPLAAVADAHAAVLTYAGAPDVTGEAVYDSMLQGVAAAANGETVASTTIAAVRGLLAMMMPPATVAKMFQTQGAPAKNLNRQHRRAAAKLSRKHSS